MAIYWPTPVFKGRTFKLCVVIRWDFDFCVCSSPLRGLKKGLTGLKKGVTGSRKFETTEESTIRLVVFSTHWIRLHFPTRSLIFFFQCNPSVTSSFFPQESSSPFRRKLKTHLFSNQWLQSVYHMAMRLPQYAPQAWLSRINWQSSLSSSSQDCILTDFVAGDIDQRQTHCSRQTLSPAWIVRFWFCFSPRSGLVIKEASLRGSSRFCLGPNTLYFVYTATVWHHFSKKVQSSQICWQHSTSQIISSIWLIHWFTTPSSMLILLGVGWLAIDWS